MPKLPTWGQLTRPAKVGVLFSLGVLAIVLGFCVLLLVGFFGP
jgi:high-affinity nickel permease